MGGVTNENALSFIQIFLCHISKLHLGLEMHTCDQNTSVCCEIRSVIIHDFTNNSKISFD